MLRSKVFQEAKCEVKYSREQSVCLEYSVLGSKVYPQGKSYFKNHQPWLLKQGLPFLRIISPQCFKKGDSS